MVIRGMTKVRVMLTILAVVTLTGLLWINESAAYLISGVITDSNNQPVNGMQVFLTDGITSGMAPYMTTTSASTGHFKFTGVTNGTYHLSIVSAKGGCYQFVPSNPASVSVSGADATLNIQAARCTAMDTDTPTQPTNLTATAVNSSRIALSWTASSDDVGVAAYYIYKNGAYLKKVTGVTAADTGLSATTQYCYIVAAVDAAGNRSAQSTQACATTPAVDNTAPSVPTGLTATAYSSNTIDLSWSPSTDNVGVTNYKVYRGGTLIANAGTVTTFSNVGLTPNTQYCYTVSAADAAGNVSAQSAQQCATTKTATSCDWSKTNPCTIIPNKNLWTYSIGIGPGKSKYFTVILGGATGWAQFGFSSQDQIAISHMIVEQANPDPNIDSYYATALAWYNADPANRYSTTYSYNYPPMVWARMKQTPEGEAIDISAAAAGTYFVVIHNTDSAKTATLYIYAQR